MNAMYITGEFLRKTDNYHALRSIETLETNTRRRVFILYLFVVSHLFCVFQHGKVHERNLKIYY